MKTTLKNKKSREAYQRRRKDALESGICPVGHNPPRLSAVNRTLCEMCLTNRKDKRNSRLLQHLCIAGCGSKVDNGTKCDTCKTKHLATRFGLTLDECKLLFDRSDNKCNACGSKSTLVIDHDHKTMTIRGILCKQCNIALGASKDNILILRSLIDYLIYPPASFILTRVINKPMSKRS